MPPTIILVHGAFAESASWDGVIDPLLDAGHPVIAAANPCAESPPTPPPSATWSAPSTALSCSSPTRTAAW
jgi:pimeloyl-ACP methyl ester carboxylesterase